LLKLGQEKTMPWEVNDAVKQRWEYAGPERTRLEARKGRRKKVRQEKNKTTKPFYD
jgi:hypothetical protein